MPVRFIEMAPGDELIVDGHARIRFDQRTAGGRGCASTCQSDDAILLHNKAVPSAPATMPLSKTENSR